MAEASREATTTPDAERAADSFCADMLAGLARRPRRLPCKHFYDKRGSELFDRICALPEYYLTRTETALMREHAPAMSEAIGPRALVIELGSGSSTKTTILLDALHDPVGYVPVDISEAHLLEAASRIERRYPELEVLPLAADFGAALELPTPSRAPRRRIVYFPGSTIGNLDAAEARRFLARLAALAGPRGGVLVGYDLRKPASILLPAYDDAAGVTAAFNLNLLERMNRELGADFDLDAFRHEAVWNDRASRIEISIVSRRSQQVTVAGRVFELDCGERILTEHSHKYTLESFAELACGLDVERTWTDARGWFCVQLLRPSDARTARD